MVWNHDIFSFNKFIFMYKKIKNKNAFVIYFWQSNAGISLPITKDKWNVSLSFKKMSMNLRTFLNLTSLDRFMDSFLFSNVRNFIVFIIRYYKIGYTRLTFSNKGSFRKWRPSLRFQVLLCIVFSKNQFFWGCNSLHSFKKVLTQMFCRDLYSL